MQRRRWRRLFFRGKRLHPLWQAAIYLAAIFFSELAASLLLGLAFALLIQLTGGPTPELLEALRSGRFPRSITLTTGVIRLLLYGGLALALGRFLDREPTATMGLVRARAGRDGGLGLLLGLVAMLCIGGLRLALGWAEIRPGQATVGVALFDTLALLPLAAAEEIAYRGYLQRIFSTWRGPLAGVLIPSLVFALFHGFNPHVSWLALLNIALAGVVFALAVEWSGTLWLALGYHFAWNLAQGPLLGMPVSGLDWPGLLALGTAGPPLWTGGLFGPEGGLLATGILLLSLLPLYALLRRPASAVGAYRRQRAVVERRFGPLPQQHHRVNVGQRFFDDVRRSALRGDREGEVTLLLQYPDGSLLLHTKSSYPPGTYRLPSGGIRQREGVLEAACREIAEETGLAASGVRPLGLVTYLLCEGKGVFFHSWLVLAQVEGEPAPQDPKERIIGFRSIRPLALRSVAADLRALPPDWLGWGRFRALVHEHAARWLDAPERQEED